MKNSSASLESSLSNVKPDPFALADLDRLADEILETVKDGNPDLDTLQRLAGEMKLAAAAVTEFFIEMA